MTSTSHQSKPPSFWSRQFAGGPTEGQVFFDVMAGVVIPLFCLIADLPHYAFQSKNSPDSTLQFRYNERPSRSGKERRS